MSVQAGALPGDSTGLSQEHGPPQFVSAFPGPTVVLALSPRTLGLGLPGAFLADTYKLVILELNYQTFPLPVDSREQWSLAPFASHLAFRMVTG